MRTSARTIDQCNGRKVSLDEEILTDGSKGYRVIILSGCMNAEIGCVNIEAAEALFTLLGNENDYFVYE